MKKYCNTILFFSVFLLFFAGSQAHANGIVMANKYQSHSAIVSPVDNIEHISIRHRSPLQNETIVIDRTDHIILSTIVPDRLQSYYSRWFTYFSNTLNRLPDQAVYLPSFALRAPPFYC
jgi:hypothetical protein